MRVVAIRKGFYGQLIEPGQEFEVPDDAKGTWFAPVGKGESRGVEAAAGAKAGKNATTTKQVDAITKGTPQK